MSSLESLQSTASTLLSTNSQKSTVFDNIAEQSINALSTIGQNFSELLANSQEENTQQQEKLLLTIDNVVGNLNTMQDELLSNLLGYNSGLNALVSGKELITDIDTVFSLDNAQKLLQNNILTALQANSTLNNTEQEASVLTDIVTFSFNDDGLGLEDAFNTLNILQHIPVVSSVYQSVTNQEDISMGAQLAGDFLYGGPIGLAYSLLDLAIENYSGTSINDTISQFDYSSILFGQENSDNKVSAKTTLLQEATKTLFFDRDGNYIKLNSV